MDTLNTSESHFNTSPPRSLYHYTDALVDILESKEIWASKVQCLNDSQEIKRALNLARKNLKELIRHNQSMQSIQELEGMIWDIEHYESVNIFAASFTGSGDSVSQYDRYGRYAIGFTSKSLAVAGSNSWRFHLAQCVYDEKRQTELVRYAIRRGLPAGVRVDDIWPPFSLGNLESVIQDSFTNALVTVAPLIKDPIFKTESEWRLVSLNCQLLEKYRTGKTGNVPYFPLPLADDGVVEVVIGRGPEQRRAYDCATALSDRLAMGFSVRLSELVPPG